MIQAAKIIGTGLDTIGLIGAGVAIGIVFGALILGVARYPLLKTQLFFYAILGFAFALLTAIIQHLLSTFDLNCIATAFDLVWFAIYNFGMVFDLIDASIVEPIREWTSFAMEACKGSFENPAEGEIWVRVEVISSSDPALPSKDSLLTDTTITEPSIPSPDTKSPSEEGNSEE